ncbi:hypothetical protein [Streptomyces sp. NPDC087294]|uniref:hypothetical protein n=1 Tax=Streptomyces sp. NPDC087294 TaxID=3365777 RepID=UPI00382331B4
MSVATRTDRELIRTVGIEVPTTRPPLARDRADQAIGRRMPGTGGIAALFARTVDADLAVSPESHRRTLALSIQALIRRHLHDPEPAGDSPTPPTSAAPSAPATASPPRDHRHQKTGPPARTRHQLPAGPRPTWPAPHGDGPRPRTGAFPAPQDRSGTEKHPPRPSG